MQTDKTVSINGIDKAMVIAVAVLLSLLSFLQIISGFNRTLDTVGSATYPNYLFLGLFIVLGLFSLSHKNKYFSVSLFLFSVVFVLGYLLSVGFSLRNIFLAFCPVSL